MFDSVNGITCEEKLRLFVEYQRLAAEYSAFVAKLALRFLSESEQEWLRAAAETARAASLQARERLQSHIAEHNCSRLDKQQAA
jgi:hypothetical protein